MRTIKCQECGNEFAVPDDGYLEIACPYCNTKIRIAPMSKVQLVKDFCKKACGKTADFLRNHPNIIKGIFIGVVTGLYVYAANSEHDTPTADMTHLDSQFPEQPEPDYYMPSEQVQETSNTVSVEQIPYTDEECYLLEKLQSGVLNGKFGEPLLNNGYGSSIQLEVRDGIPVRVKCGPGGKFFNGEENETWESTPKIDIKWRTNDQKLFFLKKYGFLSDDEEVKAYSAKYKGRV